MALNSDFAFEGFRIIRERPHVLIYWIGLSLIKFSLGMVALTLLAGPAFMSWQALEPQMREHANDPEFLNKAQVLMAQLLPAIGGIFLGWQVIDGALYAAIIRAVNQEKPCRFGYLTFGPSAWRMTLASLCVFGLLLLIVTGLLFIVVLISTLTAAIPGLMVIGSFLGFLGVVFAGLWAFVRLSFTWPATMDARRLALREGLRLTRGATPNLFGGYFLSALMAGVVSFLVQLIFALVVLGIKGEGLNALNSAYGPDVHSLETLATPEAAVSIVAASCLWPLLASLMMAAAAAYRQMKAQWPLPLAPGSAADPSRPE